MTVQQSASDAARDAWAGRLRGQGVGQLGVGCMGGALGGWVGVGCGDKGKYVQQYNSVRRVRAGDLWDGAHWLRSGCGVGDRYIWVLLWKGGEVMMVVLVVVVVDPLL